MFRVVRGKLPDKQRLDVLRGRFDNSEGRFKVYLVRVAVAIEVLNCCFLIGFACVV